MPEISEVLSAAVKSGGAVIRDNFRGSFLVENKEGVNNLVTEIDKQAEAVIIECIRKAFPDHAILSEEIGQLATEADYRWVIDPIDGTVNFVHGIPICCVSIAVLYKDELLMGAVYNPMMEELFWAEAGKGAWLNKQPISVSSKDNFEKACLVTGFPYEWPEGGEHPVKVFERFILKKLPVRRLGSAALDLCWVACGRFDGFWEYQLNAWDVAAGILIVREAGGVVTNFSNTPSGLFDKEILATNGKIHESMRQLIIGD